MKSFLLHIGLFISIVFGIYTYLYVTNSEEVKLSANIYEYRRQQGLLERGDSITAITLGNSRNRAIDFKYLQLRGYHYWRPGGDLFETFVLLKEVEDKLPNLKTVFIPINFTSLLDNSGHEGIRRPFYSIRPFSSPQPNDLRVWAKSKFYFFSSEYEKNKIGNKESDDFEIDRYGVIRPKQGVLALSRDSLILHGRYRAKMHLKRIGKHKRSDAELKSDFIKNIRKIIFYSKSKGYRLVFYSPPLYKSYINVLEESLHVDPRNILLAMSKEYDVEYYDFSRIDSLNSDVTIFKNSDHLNLEYGAVVFSKMLKEVMENDSNNESKKNVNRLN